MYIMDFTGYSLRSGAATQIRSHKQISLNMVIAAGNWDLTVLSASFEYQLTPMSMMACVGKCLSGWKDVNQEIQPPSLDFISNLSVHEDKIEVSLLIYLAKFLVITL